jgi:hypothetical protein
MIRPLKILIIAFLSFVAHPADLEAANTDKPIVTNVKPTVTNVTAGAFADTNVEPLGVGRSSPHGKTSLAESLLG